MTDLAVTVSTFHFVHVIEQHTAPAAVAITAGQWCYTDTAGKWALANATTATLGGTGRRAMAKKSVAAGEALTCVYRGLVDPHGALDALAFGAAVFLSDTVGGVMADAAGTVSIVLGNIVGGWASGATADKLLRING